MSIAFGAVGAENTGNNTNVTPLPFAFPTGITAGQLLLLGIYSNSVTPGAGPDSGFTFIQRAPAAALIVELWGKLASGSESGNVSYTGGDNHSVMGQVARFTGSFPAISAILDQGNSGSGGSAGTAIAHGAITVNQPNELIVVVGGEAGVAITYSDAANGGAFTQISTNVAASASALCWNYWIQTTATNVITDTFTFASVGARAALVVGLMPFVAPPPPNPPISYDERIIVPRYAFN